MQVRIVKTINQATKLGEDGWYNERCTRGRRQTWEERWESKGHDLSQKEREYRHNGEGESRNDNVQQDANS